MSIAKLLGQLIGHTQDSEKNKKPGVFGAPASNKNSNVKTTTLDEALNLLGQGFLKGGVGSFLKGSVVSPELRVGVGHAYVEMIKYLGPVFLERHLVTILQHILELASNPKAGNSHTESVCSR